MGTQKKWPSLTGKHPVRLLPFPAPRLFVCYKQEMLRVYNCIQLDISCWDVQFGIINRYTNSYISMIPNPLISSHHWAQRTPFIQLAFGGIPQTWTNPSRPYHSVKYPTTSHHIYPHFSFQYIALNPQQNPIRCHVFRNRKMIRSPFNSLKSHYIPIGIYVPIEPP